jgi:hypothetical protein
MGQSKTGSGDQNHDHQAVFDVVACLQCVVQKSKISATCAHTQTNRSRRSPNWRKCRRTLPFDAICRLGVKRTHVAAPIYCYFMPEENLKE